MVDLFFFFLLACNSCVAQTQDISQPVPFLAAELGNNVTIECHVTMRNVERMVWYKLTTGRKLQCVAKSDIFYKYVNYLDTFDDGRFSVRVNEGIFHLQISATKQEDVGTYYCGVVLLHSIEFGPGTVFVPKGIQLSSGTVVQQPVSESVQPGASVTLSCTIHTEACAGGHSVYWFRHGSGASRPGIIYTHGDRRSDQCERSPEAGSPTQSCVYHLPKRNLSLSDAGTYYCAVASCGETLFGNGTKLDIIVSEDEFPFPTVLALAVSNVALGVVSIVLVGVLCKTHSRNPRGVNDGPVLQNQNQDSDVLNYAAVSFAPRSSSSSTRPRVNASSNAAVYSEVNCRYEEHLTTRQPSSVQPTVT